MKFLNRLSLYGLVGLKGCAAVRLRLYGVTYCFVNCHLSAHESCLPERVAQYNQIVDEVKFKTDRETECILHHE